MMLRERASLKRGFGGGYFYDLKICLIFCTKGERNWDEEKMLWSFRELPTSKLRREALGRVFCQHKSIIGLDDIGLGKAQTTRKTG